MDYDKKMYARSIFHRRQVDELHEIEKHKWFESEKSGRDIGGNLAALDWMLKYRKIWNRNWAKNNKTSEESAL